MEPVPVETVVLYHEKPYVITGHQDPSMLFTEREREIIESAHMTLAEAYPDGVAYAIFPVGMPWKVGNIRNYGIHRVRRGSLQVQAPPEQPTVVDDA